MIETVTLPRLWGNNDIKKLNYPEDIQVGLYVWDENMEIPILITDQSSVDIHKSCFGHCSRSRFATKEEIIHKFSTNGYNTVYEMDAYNKSKVIYYLF